MFWSGETLLARLPTLSADFKPAAVDCNAWTLTIGKKIYITPTAIAAKSGSHTVQDLKDGESFQIPPGQFAFLQTSECVKVPTGAMAFISVKATIKLKGLINVSGFHVDPGFEGVLLFTVFNAGPSPIHLHQGQQCFLIWFASLDNEHSAFVKTSPSVRQVDGNTVSGIAGSLQSFDDFSGRLTEVEHRVRLHRNIGGAIAAAVISAVVALVGMQLKKDPAPLVIFQSPSVSPSGQSTLAPFVSDPVYPAQAQPIQKQPPLGADVIAPSGAARP